VWLPGMSTFPTVLLARHGETAWSLSGQHTGLTDLPLTERGEINARALAAPLAGMTFSLVLTSPLASEDRDLVEWDYGDYEGKRTVEILAGRPGWKLFRDGCPGGESPADVGLRA